MGTLVVITQKVVKKLLPVTDIFYFTIFINLKSVVLELIFRTTTNPQLYINM